MPESIEPKSIAALPRAPNRQIVLASRSPRRVELLRAAGLEFSIDPADIDEDSITQRASLAPRDLALLLAREKAGAIALRHPGALVIGADTVVAVGAAIYGKAEDESSARAMLKKLFGTDQRVITGVAVALYVSDFESGELPDRTGRVARSGPLIRSDCAESVVHMRAMSDSDLDAYVRSGAWRGKAGAYGIQDDSVDPFVTLISGEFDNVVGLPVDLTLRLLEESGRL